MKLTRQFDRMDCGPACVKMIASHFGKEFSLQYLRQHSHLTREGVSITGIRKALDYIGIKSMSFEITAKQLYDDFPLPAILYWEQNHFVVLNKIKGKDFNNAKFVIANPAFGWQDISLEDMKRHWENNDKGIVIAVEPEKKFYSMDEVKADNSFYKFSKKYIFPYKLQLIQLFIALAISAILGFISPFLTQAVVDDGIFSRNIGLVTSILIAQLAIFIGMFITNVTEKWVSLYMGTHISINVISEYLYKLFQLPMTFFETKSIGDYQQRMNDNTRIQQFLTGNTLSSFFSIITVPFYLFVIACYSFQIFCTFVFFTIISGLWTYHFFNKRKAIDYEQFHLSAENQNIIYEMMSGITDIKLNNCEKYKLQEWQNIQKKQFDVNQKSLNIGQKQAAGSAAIGQIRDILITYWVAYSVIEGNLTFGMMMSVSTVIGMVSSPLSQLINILQDYQNAKISMERSQEVHHTQPEDMDNLNSITDETSYSIELNNVSFCYDENTNKKVLNNITLSIPPKSMVAIVGESGSGKTTLMKLLLKCYTPSTGKIIFNNVDIQTLSASSIRKITGVVMQENFIFSGTLKQNITMGEKYDEQKFNNIIHLSCLDGFISSHPLGINTKIGIDGIGLSGGEKQRIMIARALYKNPQILMMDEATSSLDAENEAIITRNIEEKFNDRTRIIIAHRLSTVCKADKIFVMKHGSIVEEGTHESLVSQRGYYYNLVYNQLNLAKQ